MRNTRCQNVLLLALILAGAAFGDSPRVAPERGTVLTGDAARKVFKQCSRPSPRDAKEFWNPSSKEIKPLEESLITFLKSQNLAGEQRKSAPDYYRQYAGFLRDGRKIIYINAFSPEIMRETEESNREQIKEHRPVFDWKREPVMICDGGDLVYGAEFDTTTGKFQAFSFNGR